MEEGKRACGLTPSVVFKNVAGCVHKHQELCKPVVQSGGVKCHFQDCSPSSGLSIGTCALDGTSQLFAQFPILPCKFHRVLFTLVNGEPSVVEMN